MATLARRDQVTLPGVGGRRWSALPALVLMALALPAAAQPAPNARPAGGVVVAGTATITQSSSTTTIDQASQRAAVNWRSFNVGSQQTVDFVQPSSSAVTLNRVNDANPSEIAGRIDANGQVVIVNQSGVMFYQGAVVDTAGLIVSAAGISTTNFMNGAMHFNAAAKPNAKVVNAGTITIKDAGLAVLVAPEVANSGVINAKLGEVVLAGAKTATLDLFGDALLRLDVSNEVTETPEGATALVTNTGRIVAKNGTIELTARAADGVIQTLIKAGGKVSATDVVLRGVGGAIVVTGKGYPPQ
jgi:filamentous hemagglutinin family protein